ncbi:hypothetical protein K438DRAFT_1949263 [Mycena galopus ATCC 62051]|nr:hypothetical protein K438DRAFT_1949263 [Mycena galopus ATCC 62051]
MSRSIVSSMLQFRICRFGSYMKAWCLVMLNKFQWKGGAGTGETVGVGGRLGGKRSVEQMQGIEKGGAGGERDMEPAGRVSSRSGAESLPSRASRQRGAEQSRWLRWQAQLQIGERDVGGDELRGGGEHCVRAVTDTVSKGVGDSVKPPVHTRVTAGGRQGQQRATRRAMASQDWRRRQGWAGVADRGGGGIARGVTWRWGCCSVCTIHRGPQNEKKKPLQVLTKIDR